MKEILPNIYAVEVPKEAYQFEIYDKESLPMGLFYLIQGLSFSLPRIEQIPHAKYNILGTATPTEIDFDCVGVSRYLGCYDGKHLWKSYDSNNFFGCDTPEESLRLAITAAGITQYDKLVILQKL